ncbi:MAG: hypothetical protein ACW99U_17795 [Candidatus Thorarchaeota archaeon]|jgi:hypothetical protein
MTKIEKPPSGSQHHIQNMLPRHFRILDLMLAGLKNVEIAEVVGMTPQAIGIISRSPLFKAELNRRLKDRNGDAVEEEVTSIVEKTRTILENSAEEAANTQVDLLGSEDHSVRLRASGSILDRVLGKAEGQETSIGTQVNVQINAKDAHILTQALHESKEIHHGRIQSEPAADSSATCSSENGQRDVHQASQLSAGVGHREAEAQAPQEQVSEDVPPSPTVDPEAA